MPESMALSHVRPVLDQTRGDAVVAWRFRLTLTDGETRAMDELEVTTTMPQRPLAAWTQHDVKLLLELAAREHPLAMALRRTLAARKQFREVTDFDLGSLPNGEQA